MTIFKTINKTTLVNIVAQSILKEFKNQDKFNTWWQLLDENTKDKIYWNIQKIIYHSYQEIEKDNLK